MSIIIGVDIGGTFTDLVMYDETTGKTHVAKVPSTPENFSIGLIKGLGALPVNFSEIGLIVHGTTVATNAVLERKGARCGLIMTKGFRDVIELRRRDRPQTYGLKGQFKPLVSRDCRVEVDDRMDFRGTVLVEPTEFDLAEAAKNSLKRMLAGVSSVLSTPTPIRPTNKRPDRCWKNSGRILSSLRVLRSYRKSVSLNAPAPLCSTVTAPSEAWCILRGESPRQVRVSHPPVPSVAPVAESTRVGEQNR